MMWISILLVILLVLFSAGYDTNKRFTNHAPRFIFRAIVVALISLIGDNYLVTLILNSVVFYILFDYTLNIMEKREWNYIGKTSEIDKIKNKMPNPKLFDLVHKIILLILSILIQ